MAQPSNRVVIPHVDDLGCSHGANVAMLELVDAGLVTCGSVMPPAGWFPEIAAAARDRPELDLGVHLTLTSESARFRWRPLSTTSRGSGLFDDAGYLWPDTTSLRRNARPVAVAAELRAQVECVLEAGIDVTHLDHHMGAALAPEFVALTADVAREFHIPMLFLPDMGPYLADVKVADADRSGYAALRESLARDGLAFADHFAMGLSYQEEPCRPTFERLFSGLPEGVTYLSLHCSAPGDIEAVHPGDAHWRIAEYDLFGDREFVEWVTGSDLVLTGTRRLLRGD